MYLEDLIQLAEKFLHSDAPSAELVEVLHAYGLAFDAWHAHSPGRNEAEPLLRTLSEKHSRVIEKAKSLQGNTTLELRRLRSRAKGLLAYADVEPRRVSTRKGKKG